LWSNLWAFIHPFDVSIECWRLAGKAKPEAVIDFDDSTSCASMKRQIQTRNSMSDEQEKQTNTYKRATKNMTVLGGARSLFSTAREGGEVIGEGVRALGNATKGSMKPGRFETFSQAMARLGIAEEQLAAVSHIFCGRCRFGLWREPDRTRQLFCRVGGWADRHGFDHQNGSIFDAMRIHP
jgi:hypothetical protein